MSLPSKRDFEMANDLMKSVLHSDKGLLFIITRAIADARQEGIDTFLNRVRSLYNIDGELLPELMSWQKHEFIRDPPRYLINTDRVQKEAILREVEKRQ